MKLNQFVQHAAVVVLITGCNLNPAALLGSRDESYDEQNDPNPVVQAPSQGECRDAKMVLKEKTDAADCATPDDLDLLVRRVEGTDKLILHLNPLRDKQFVRTPFVAYIRGNRKLNPEMRALKCKNMTPMDDMSTKRIFECEMTRKASSPYKNEAFTIDSIEFRNEKCAARAQFVSTPKNPSCAPDDASSMFTRLGSDYFPSLSDVLEETP